MTKWVVVTFKLPADLLEDLDTFALSHKQYRSEVIRNALVEYLQKRKQEEIIPKAKVEKLSLG